MRKILCLIAFLMVAGVSATAWACINDRETPKYERDYQQQYEPDPPYEPEDNRWNYAGVGAGAGMLGMAGFVLSLKLRV